MTEWLGQAYQRQEMCHDLEVMGSNHSQVLSEYYLN